MANDFEKGVDKISQEVSKAAENMKETASNLGGWWKKSSTEEKIATICGVLLLIWGLRKLRQFLWGVILLMLGFFLISGYFDRPLRRFINWCKSIVSEKKTKNSESKKEETLEKVEVKDDKEEK